jgi:hypothetical protein
MLSAGLPLHTSFGFFLDSQGCFSIVFARKRSFLSITFIPKWIKDTVSKGSIGAFIIGLNHHKGD